MYNNKIEMVIPQYKKIAIDIAAKIVDGKYPVGSKLHARSTLASHYGVSSETARRAMSVLADLDIVTLEQGSGCLIKSYEEALAFTRQYQQVQTIGDVKQKMLESVARQRREIEFFNTCLSELMEKTERFRSLNPFIPFQININATTPFLNKTTADIKFWQNTGATIIAIKRGSEIMLSPGPYATFMEGDVVYFIGMEGCVERAEQFLYPTE